MESWNVGSHWIHADAAERSEFVSKPSPWAACERHANPVAGWPFAKVTLENSGTVLAEERCTQSLAEKLVWPLLTLLHNALSSLLCRPCFR